MGYLDAPGVPDGAEHRLLVVPPDPAQFQVVVPTERPGGGRRDSSVHHDKLEALGDALSRQVLQHQFRGPVLMPGSRHDQSAQGEPGHVDSHDALGALGTAVRAAAVVEGEPSVGGSAGQVVSTTTIDGVGSQRPATSRAAA